jgi:hypothetical protein
LVIITFTDILWKKIIKIHLIFLKHFTNKTMNNHTVFSVIAGGALLVLSTLSGFAEDAANLTKQIEGDWITYRGDQFELKSISKGKEKSTFYNWRGEPLFERSADLKLASKASGESKTLISQGETWHYLAGGKKPDDNSWTGLSFDTQKKGWKTGKAGFGYGDDDDETVLSDMQNKYTSIYIRKEFEIPEDADLKRLGLLIKYDDGFVMHANGRRLFNSNSISVNKETGEMTVNNHEANNVSYFPLSEYASAFRTGKNIIAIEGHNTTLDSTDFSLDPQLILGGSGSFVKSNRSETHRTRRTQWYYKDRTWNGKIDELQIWGRALSDDEVASLWNRGKGSSSVSKEVAEELIGHWHFDGTLKDSSGNGRHGKGENSPGFAEGKFGKALNLNGDNQFVTLGGKAGDYTPSSGSITTSLWFNVNRFDKRWQTLISMGDNGWADWRIHRHQMTPNISYIGAAFARNNTKIDDGKMHHLVAVTEKDKEVRLYIDNILVANNGGNNGIGELEKDQDGWLPALGANLQSRISLATPLEGEFIPMQDSLRVYTKPSGQSQGGANQAQSGVFRKVSHPEEALLIAARKGNLKKVSELLKSGVDPNVTSTNSYTALAYAASGGHLDVMKLLIGHKKIDVNKASRFLKTPLLVAVGSPHIEAVKLLIANGASIKSTQAQGAACIHEAAIWGQPEMLDFLLKEQGVDPNLRAKNGQTGLHFAMWRMLPGLPEENKPYMDCVKILLKHGTNPDLRWNRVSALQMALNNRLEEAAKLLR